MFASPSICVAIGLCGMSTQEQGSFIFYSLFVFVVLDVIVMFKSSFVANSSPHSSFSSSFDFELEYSISSMFVGCAIYISTGLIFIHSHYIQWPNPCNLKPISNFIFFILFGPMPCLPT